MTTQLSNQIRGLMNTFGLVVPKGPGRVFERHVCSLLANNAGLKQIIEPLLDAWRGMRARHPSRSSSIARNSKAAAAHQIPVPQYPDDLASRERDRLHATTRRGPYQLWEQIAGLRPVKSFLRLISIGMGLVYETVRKGLCQK
ncbi:hypothetical protein [Bradyrhizobium sp. CSA207]|uniref:hypothetical protein n=1 Tax=Bradyrhizobium sp. CSA207 TaxID=2698826 RepID=UPI0023AE9DC3|nr:hypothetical protein [Bradyrhizobium sp. CSA207]